MPTSARTVEEIEEWLAAYLARALELSAESIDMEASFQEFGIESSAAAALTGDLAEWMGIEIDPTIVFEHPSIARLAARLGNS